MNPKNTSKHKVHGQWLYINADFDNPNDVINVFFEKNGAYHNDWSKTPFCVSDAQHNRHIAALLCEGWI